MKVIIIHKISHIIYLGLSSAIYASSVPHRVAFVLVVLVGWWILGTSSLSLSFPDFADDVS